MLRAKRWEGAYYLCGYAAECALKACVAKRTERHEFPDRERIRASYTHNLTDLLTAADLKKEHIEAMKDGRFAMNWVLVAQWSAESRYERPSQSDAEGILKALEERKHGVLRWVRRHW